MCVCVCVCVCVRVQSCADSSDLLDSFSPSVPFDHYASLCCFVRYCFQNLFKIARSILV